MAGIQSSTASSSLADVISIILDKGIVIDAWATVSLVGIQLLSIEARIVIASVDTYLKYAAAVGLLAPVINAPMMSQGTANVALPAPSTAGANMAGAMKVPVGAPNTGA
jgi:gas vesicle structural protein